MGDWGFAVKKQSANVNVTDASVQQLAASSKFNCFKVFQENVVTVPYTANTGQGSTSIVNPLAFPPMMMAFCEINPGEYYAISPQGKKTKYTNFVYSSTPTGIYFTVNIAQAFNPSDSYYGTTKNFPVKYFLFGDTAATQSTTTAVPNATGAQIKVMKPGYDAGTDNYVEHLIWSSVCPPMKIATAGSFGPVALNNSAPIITTITHNLGYAPAFLAMRADAATGQFYTIPSYSGADGSYCAAYSTPTQLIFYEEYVPVTAMSTSYKYIIFAEKASTT